MKKLLIILAVLCAVLLLTSNTYSQDQTDEIKSLNEQIVILKKTHSDLLNKIKSGDSQLQKAVDSLQRQLLQVDLKLTGLGGKLSADIQRTDSKYVCLK